MIPYCSVMRDYFVLYIFSTLFSNILEHNLILYCVYLPHASLWAGALCLEHDEGASLHSGAVDLPWQDELCCDSPSAHLTVEGDDTRAPETNRSESNLPHHPRCSFRSSTTKSDPNELSGGRFLHWYPKEMINLKLVELLLFWSIRPCSKSQLKEIVHFTPCLYFHILVRWDQLSSKA